MPEYLSPGVYVEEIDAGPKPIEGVSTSTTGAVGVTRRGPTDGKPELVTSFAEFARKFGGFLAEPDAATVTAWTTPDRGRWWHFPLSVKGYFDNGGKRLYVKRVFSSTAVAASATLGRGLVSEVAQDTASGLQNVRLRTLIGIGVAPATLRLFNGDTGAQIGPLFNVTGYDSVTSQVTLDAPLPDDLVASRGDFAEVHPRSAAPVPAAQQTLIFEARSRGDWGNELRVRVRPTVGTTLRLLASSNPAVAGNAVSTTVDNLAAAGANAVDVVAAAGIGTDDHIVVQGRTYQVTGVAGNTLNISPAVPPGPGWAVGTEVQRLRRANVAGAGLVIGAWGANKLYDGALVELDNGFIKEVFTVDSVAGDAVTLTGAANIDELYFEGNRLRVVEADVRVQVVTGGEVEEEETFPPLRLVADGSASNLVEHINDRSDLVRVRTSAPGFSSSNIALFPTATTGGWQDFGGGADNINGLTVDDFVGADGGSGNRTGIQALEDIDEISICLAPGMWSPTIHGSLIQHCELLKDRFAVLDPQDGLSIEEIRAAREVLDSRYGALYYPWLTVRDPSIRRNVDLAPSAHMAGIYARVDVERGVHKAPANEVIRGITGLAQDVNQREQDLLNPKGINALRFFPNRGFRVWGARTVTSDASWKYINVRRLFIFVEESIDEGTQWVVFEPNDEPLWARVRQTVSNFLTSVWRGGALQGATADEAFFVRCDRSTMTQDDIDNGRLICLVGIAPVKPAEFVIFRIQQKTLEAAG